MTTDQMYCAMESKPQCRSSLYRSSLLGVQSIVNSKILLLSKTSILFSLALIHEGVVQTHRRNAHGEVFKGHGPNPTSIAHK